MASGEFIATIVAGIALIRVKSKSISSTSKYLIENSTSAIPVSMKSEIQILNQLIGNKAYEEPRMFVALQKIFTEAMKRRMFRRDSPLLT